MWSIDFDEFLVQPSPAPTTPSSILPSPSIASGNVFAFGAVAPQPAGPVNATYKIPPRPKPGRKPATDEPQTKRKAQNREAQRNFRQRKAQRLNELEGERERKDREHYEEKEHLQTRIDSLTREVAQLTENEQNAQRQLQDTLTKLQRAEDERNHFRSLYESSTTPSTRGGYGHDVSTPSSMAGASVSSPAFSLTPLTNPSSGEPAGRATSTTAGCDDCQPEKGSCACINAFTKSMEEPLSPMSDVRMRDADERSNYDDREIDFTTQRPAVDKRPSVAFITGATVDDGCGFCTDESNCLCAQEAKLSMEQPKADTNTLPPIRTRPVTMRSSSTEDSHSRRNPGSCRDCQSNPRQRQWCQSVARQATPHRPSQNATTASSSSSTTPRYSVGCSEAFHIFNKRVPIGSSNDSSMDWTSDLETLPPGASRKIYFSHLHPENQDPPQPDDRKYTAVEIDSASILTALTRHDRRHSVDKRKDNVLQKTVRFLEDLPDSSKEEGKREGTSTPQPGKFASSIGRILN